MFYDKTVKLYTRGAGVIDDAGICTPAEPIYVKNIECDIQPYSSELLYKNYGYKEECTMRIFCEKDSVISLGNIVEYNAKLYNIVKIIEWDYCEVMINDIYI